MTSSVRISASISATFSITLLCMLAAIATQPAQGQTLTVLHGFQAGFDGGAPAAGLTMDDAGNLYGTTSGDFGVQTSSVFELRHPSAGWVLNPIFTFYPDNQSQGYGLFSKVVIGPDGALYGSARGGGLEECNNQGCGTVFKLQPRARSCPDSLCEWNITVLHYFTPDSGALPDQIVFGPDGSIYGTTLTGGNLGDCAEGCGTVFQLTHSGGTWTMNTLYEFNGTDGDDPVGGVILDSAGNLYGTTYRGGDFNQGVLYKLSPSQGSWTQTILHTFAVGGANPPGALTMDASGNIYGVTTGGYLNVGSVFEWSPASGNFQTIFTLYSAEGPQGGLLIDGAGNIYGTKYEGGPSHYGSIYKLTSTNGSWSYTKLYDFSGDPGGAFPNGGLITDAHGNLYGTCNAETRDAAGTAWQLTP